MTDPLLISFRPNVDAVINALYACNVVESKIHPIELRIKAAIYKKGSGFHRHRGWIVNPVICDALDAAYQTALNVNVEPSDKSYCIAMDVSSEWT